MTDDIETPAPRSILGRVLAATEETAVEETAATAEDVDPGWEGTLVDRRTSRTYQPGRRGTDESLRPPPAEIYTEVSDGRTGLVTQRGQDLPPPRRQPDPRQWLRRQREQRGSPYRGTGRPIYGAVMPGALGWRDPNAEWEFEGTLYRER